MKEYRVIKNFSMADFMVAHQKHYGWTEFKRSCKGFQNDITTWVADVSFECTDRAYDPKNHPSISSDFWKHAVMFGFMEEVKPEVFYKVGDKVDWAGEEVTIIQRGNEIALLRSTNNNIIVNGRKYPDSQNGFCTVEDVNKIRQSDLEKLTGLFVTKIED